MFLNINYDPPFLKEINNFLNIKKNGIYIDCTFGSGKHSIEILSKLNVDGRLFAFDCDYESLFVSKNVINDIRFKIINDNFIYLKHYMNNFLLTGNINGILFDLGISYYQLNNPFRGFTFMKNGPLDMRMNRFKGVKASYWINKATFNEIYKVIKNLGEEHYAKTIAKNILFYRKKFYINKTLELSKIINYSVKSKKYFKHKSTRTFQAIRIFINDELNNLKKALNVAYDVLAPGGRLVVISFHSLEDRIVKNFIKSKCLNNINLLDNIPLTEKFINDLYPVTMLNLGKYRPSNKDINNNNRIRSAILRVAEKK